MIGKEVEVYGNLEKILKAKDVHNHLNGWKPLFYDLSDLWRCFK